MCERNETPDVYDVMVERWFNLGHDDAALREGWFLTPCDGSEHGPLQVQRADDAAAPAATLFRARRGPCYSTTHAAMGPSGPSMATL
jgi:hypothetical protein